MPEVATRGLMKTIVNADLRDGVCMICNVHLDIRKVKLSSVHENILPKDDKLVDRAICPQCGELGSNVGHLIVRHYSIQAPDPPQCISPGCLWKFVLDSLFVAFLSSYHSRRVAYAVANRPDKGKEILERYRTGEPSPKNLWQAIHANLKLHCFVCRQYDVDPFLFRSKND